MSDETVRSATARLGPSARRATGQARLQVVRSLAAAVAALTLLLAGCANDGESATIQGTPLEASGAASATTAAPEPSPEVKRPVYRLAAPDDPAALTIPDTNYFGWALLDRKTGAVTGSPNEATEGNTVESMIKPWIVADFLRQLSENGETPSQEVLDELTLVIVDSNDPLAESYYQQGGAFNVLRRLADRCGLTNLRIGDSWWSTYMTPEDAVHYGECIADGRGAGPQWTPWLLNVMTQVRGGVDEQISGTVQGGRWGIIDGLPPELAAEVSIKNGFTSYMDGWHVNCMAIHAGWVLVVMMRSWQGLAGAADGCAQIAKALVVEGPGG